MITEYFMIGSLAIAAAGGGFGYYQNERNKALSLELAAERGELATCGARLVNLLEDIRDDATIDNLPDSALTVVPPHWLRPEGNPTGN